MPRKDKKANGIGLLPETGPQPKAERQKPRDWRLVTKQIREELLPKIKEGLINTRSKRWAAFSRGRMRNHCGPC